MELRFDNPEEARQWADDWLETLGPSPVVTELVQYEQEHRLRALREYGRMAAQFEAHYTALVQLIDQVNFVDRSSWPQHRAIQYVLLSYNLKPFWSAVDRLIKGFYEDALTLLRGLYETVIRVVFVSCHPEDPWGALMNKPPQGTPAFNMTNFVRDELKLQWFSKYTIMSVFAHSNTLKAIDALKRASEEQDEPERFGLRLEYDTDLVELAGAFLQFLLLVYVRFALDRLIGASEVRDPEQLQTARTSLALLTYGLDDHPKEYWKGVAADLDFLFQMLEVADRGGDWRAMVRVRRAAAARGLG